MTSFQVQCLLLVMVLTLAGPLVGSRSWFPRGAAGTVILSMVGSSIAILLRLANLPPKWFSGSAWGFTIALTLMASAFGFHDDRERAYRLPFMFSLGATLLVFNVWAHV